MTRQRFWNAVVWLLGLLAMFLLTDFVIDAVRTTENFIIGFLIGILWITILYLLISSLED